MKDPDETIASLLAGLRDAEPPPGMHRRIMDAMVEPRGTAPGPHRLLHAALAISLACALAIAIRVPHHRHRPADVRRSMTNVDTPQTKPPQTVTVIRPREPRRPAARVLLRPPLTPGFPAPPLPLTEQEKLLLRLARRNDAQDVNLLNRDVRAQQSAEAAQQFEQFFRMSTDQMRSESE